MVESREEDEHPDDDDGNGAVRMLKTEEEQRGLDISVMCSLLTHYYTSSPCVNE